jgi:hypothetical protein
LWPWLVFLAGIGLLSAGPCHVLTSVSDYEVKRYRATARRGIWGSRHRQWFLLALAAVFFLAAQFTRFGLAWLTLAVVLLVVSCAEAAIMQRRMIKAINDRRVSKLAPLTPALLSSLVKRRLMVWGVQGILLVFWIVSWLLTLVGRGSV